MRRSSLKKDQTPTNEDSFVDLFGEYVDNRKIVFPLTPFALYADSHSDSDDTGQERPAHFALQLFLYDHKHSKVTTTHLGLII